MEYVFRETHCIYIQFLMQTNMIDSHNAHAILTKNKRIMLNTKF